MVAVIETGGKQYCVTDGQTVLVNRLNFEVGEKVTLPNLLGGENITVEVKEHRLGDKVTSRKFRNKTRYYRVKGHRQPLTAITVVTNAKPAKKIAVEAEATV